MMVDEKPVVLLVDDNEDTLDMHARFFELAGYRAEKASNLEDAIKMVDKGREISIALVDYHIEKGGAEKEKAFTSPITSALLFEHIRSRASHRIRAYAYTADDTLETKLQAVWSGAFRFLVKTKDPLNLVIEYMKRDYQDLKGVALDPKTGLLNFHWFRQSVIVSMTAARDRQDEHHPVVFSMIYIDMDHFKDINDNYGHQMGDRAIEAVGETIKSHTRREEYSSHLSGDEFAICLATDAKQARARAEELRQAIPTIPTGVNGQRIALGLSIGVAELPREEIGLDAERTFNEFLNAADQDMYQDKERRKKQAS